VTTDSRKNTAHSEDNTPDFGAPDLCDRLTLRIEICSVIVGYGIWKPMRDFAWCSSTTTAIWSGASLKHITKYRRRSCALTEKSAKCTPEGAGHNSERLLHIIWSFQSYHTKKLLTEKKQLS